LVVLAAVRACSCISGGLMCRRVTEQSNKGLMVLRLVGVWGTNEVQCTGASAFETRRRVWVRRKQGSWQ